MKKVRIIFTNEWKKYYDKIDSKEEKYLDKGFEFEYDESTKFRDLMFELNKKLNNTLKSSGDKHTEDLENIYNLKFIYRIIENNKAIYVFDIDASIEKYILSKKIIEYLYHLLFLLKKEQE